MTEDLKTLYENKSIDELLEIYRIRSEYREDVAEFVRKILTMRNLTPEQEEQFMNFSQNSMVLESEKSDLGLLDKSLKRLLKFMNPLEPKSDNQMVWLLLIPVIYVFSIAIENAFYLGLDWYTVLVMGPDILLCAVLLYLLYHKKKWGFYIYIISILYKAYSFFSLGIFHLTLQLRYGGIDESSESVDLDDRFSRLLFEMSEFDYTAEIFWSFFNFVLLLVLSRTVVINRIKSIYNVGDKITRMLYFWTSLTLLVAISVMYIVYYF
ncbi:hypothetical protein [Lishizhenia sp.]|uniref:hypothetical protein n=1 Tax=Lishizhenia sp. TaxID=2497594 RepID=UPI00299E5340|nr:hypothetical protein [Lishizhenia sp.]MDX1446762.1 hypothetical protein [Lishizhenia sp.]